MPTLDSAEERAPEVLTAAEVEKLQTESQDRERVGEESPGKHASPACSSLNRATHTRAAAERVSRKREREVSVEPGTPQATSSVRCRTPPGRFTPALSQPRACSSSSTISCHISPSGRNTHCSRQCGNADDFFVCRHSCSLLPCCALHRVAHIGYRARRTSRPPCTQEEESCQCSPRCRSRGRGRRGR